MADTLIEIVEDGKMKEFDNVYDFSLYLTEKYGVSNLKIKKIEGKEIDAASVNYKAGYKLGYNNGYEIGFDRGFDKGMLEYSDSEYMYDDELDYEW